MLIQKSKKNHNVDITPITGHDGDEPIVIEEQKIFRGTSFFINASGGDIVCLTFISLERADNAEKFRCISETLSLAADKAKGIKWRRTLDT